MHMNIKNYILISLIFLFSFNSCPNSPEDHIDITVSKGTSPTYSWTGGPVNDLVVRKLPNHEIVWGIITPSKDEIYSPVTHGIIPEGAIVFEDSLGISNIDTTAFGQPLIVGQKYLVQVIWKIGKFEVGTTEFICIEQ
ncbi:hypothetical protein ACFL4T_08505 [candidate division KSB1 bacterium]